MFVKNTGSQACHAEILIQQVWRLYIITSE